MRGFYALILCLVALYLFHPFEDCMSETRGVNRVIDEGAQAD